MLKRLVSGNTRDEGKDPGPATPPADVSPEPASAPPQTSDPLAHLAWQALRRAALRSCLKLSAGEERGRSAEALSAHLLPLAEVVWNRCYGGAAVRTLPVPPLPVRMLIDTLRGDLLEEISLMSDRMDTAAVVKILQSLESVADHVNDDPSHKFSARFLGSAGLEALVEVAHDMRSPLASIVLLVETMRQGQSGPVNAVQERQLALVYGATFGLSLMANDVIDLARGDERSLEGTQMPFSIHDVMLAVKDIVQPIAEEKGLELRLEPPPSDWRRGRPSVLQRVLLNLTTNALKFTDEGFVIVSARQISRTGVEFSVIDSGRGIPAHLQNTVFDAFRQNEAGGKTTFSSSGLGLAICRKLVRAMGGEMVAENLDRGSRFHFTIDLPLASRF